MRVALVLASWALAAAGCTSAFCEPGRMQVGGACIDPSAECDITCSTHEVCDARVVPNTCECAPGYAGDPCEWAGVVQDPDFLGLEDELGERLWADEGGKGATVEPNAPGAVDPDEGVGVFAASVICNAGSLTQVVDMPSYDVAEPLVAELVYQASGVHGVAVGFDRAWKRLPPTGGEWDSATFCLGEAAYSRDPLGGPVTMRISASERLDDCLEEPSGSIRVDSFTVRPLSDGETCPTPGEALNPTASEASGEWKFVLEEAAEGALEAGAGREGTSGAALRIPAGATGRVAATVRISVPVEATVPSPALVFWWRGTSAKLSSAYLGTFAGLDDPGRPIETLLGSNAGVDALYCLPPWTHGTVLDLTFALSSDESMEASELFVDDIRVRSAEACGSSTDLADPGFESAPNRWLGSRLSSGNEQVIMQDDERLALTGSGTLELTYWTTGADLSMESYVLVPAPADDLGPAVSFQSRVPLAPSVDVRWVLGKGVADRDDVEATGDWTESLVCLPPAWAGRWFRLKVQVGPPSGPEMPIAQERIFLDDFALTTSTRCRVR